VKGLKINNFVDGPNVGFSPEHIAAFTAAMSEGDDPHAAFEDNSLDVLDSAFGGELMHQFILDSIVVENSRLSRKMRALQRAFNTSMGKAGPAIKVLEPEIGKPRKNGMIGTLTVKFPLSDGQSISVVFHAPDGDPEKITKDDTLIGFRWLLNSRDVTAWMSPETDNNGLVDIALNTLGNRVAQLVAANTAKFTERQEGMASDKEALASAQEQKVSLGNEIGDLEKSIADKDESTEWNKNFKLDSDRRIDVAYDLNDELTKQLADLQKRVEDAKAKVVPDPEPDVKDEKSIMARLEAMGMTVVQFIALFITGTTTAKFRKEKARKLGLSDFDAVRDQLNTDAKYLNKNKLTTAGENLLNMLLGKNWQSANQDIESLAKGQNVTRELNENETVQGKMVGNLDIDKPMLLKFIERVQEATDMAGWAVLAKIMADNFMQVYLTDTGAEGEYPRSMYSGYIVKAIKRAHKAGQFNAVDRALDFIQEYGDMAPKQVIAGGNGVWKLRTKMKTIFAKKYGEDIFDWGKEGTEELALKEYRDLIDTVIFRTERSGYSNDEFARVDMIQSLVEPANKLIASFCYKATKDDLEKADDALRYAENAMNRWYEIDGPKVASLWQLKEAASWQYENQMTLLERLRAVADVDGEVGEAWDKLFNYIVEKL